MFAHRAVNMLHPRCCFHRCGFCQSCLAGTRTSVFVQPFLHLLVWSLCALLDTEQGRAHTCPCCQKGGYLIQHTGGPRFTAGERQELVSCRLCCSSLVCIELWVCCFVFIFLDSQKRSRIGSVSRSTAVQGGFRVPACVGGGLPLSGQTSTKRSRCS